MSRYGQIDPVFTGVITGVTNGDNITASYSCSATANSPPGTYPIVSGLVDADDLQTNYTVTLLNGTLTITMAVPVLAWTNPASITYGAPLTSNQLNATTSVPGSFAYDATNGTVLNAGTNTLSVIFTPADTVDYGSVTDSVSLVVSPAPLTATAADATRSIGQTNPVFTGTITGVTNGDNITANYSCNATANSPVGTYPIVPGLVDPDDRQTNYTVALVNGTLTIGRHPYPGLDESRIHHLWSALDLQPVKRDDECARHLRLQPNERHGLVRRDQHAIGYLHPGGHG